MPAEASFDDFCWWQPVRWNISSALCVRKLVSEAAAKDDGHDGKVMTANEPGLAGLTHGWKAYLLVDNIKSSYERAATALTSIILWTANFQMTNVSLRIFRLQKKKFTARTFDSDTSWTQFRARVTERWSQTLQSRCREERGIWVRWGSPATDPPCYQSKMFTLSEQQQLRAEIPGGWTGPQASRDRGQTSHLPTTLRRKSVFRIMPTLTWTLWWRWGLGGPGDQAADLPPA